MHYLQYLIMCVDLEQIRKQAELMTGEVADTLRQVANEIELLRRHLAEAHTSNADSERLNWLCEQARDEYYREISRTYITWPRIKTQKNGITAMTLREAIDLVRQPRDRDL
ncbi:hypothetical protein AB3X94_29260 [Paraburkholderia sp. BR10923]|uniref:hypothetical protein n=1 Tax=Paraburkholderia sp. BR10923 TaxID=3236992 RepID=UPI0034CEAE07